MNKINLVLVALLALFIALPAGAQVKLGVIGGVNFANLSGEEVDGTKIDFSSRTVLGVGGVLDVGLNENVALRFEPMYLQKGAELTETDPDLGTATFAFKAAYLEVPVLLKIALGTSTTRPYLMAGPTIGFNLSSKLELSALGISAEIDAKEITKSTDFGLAFGAGVSFPAGTSSIFVEGRYTLGLTDIAEAGALEFMGDEIVSGDADVKTRGFQIMGGIAFPLGGK
ncbi:PorT family protein [candidate division KSB1 bacterium]|nr:PorT family protein [candidate division KSB1 bacterium]